MEEKDFESKVNTFMEPILASKPLEDAASYVELLSSS
jgi:hypothetical protein